MYNTLSRSLVAVKNFCKNTNLKADANDVIYALIADSKMYWRNRCKILTIVEGTEFLRYSWRSTQLSTGKKLNVTQR